MSNYFSALVLTALIGGTACADDETPDAAKPVAAKPAAAPATAAAKPAATAPSSLPHYLQAPGSSLGFSFEQAGATSTGSFKQFATTFDYDEKNLAASKLDVKVQIASLDTQDKDRDSTLASADLFDVEKFPSASYAANSLVKGAKGIEAVGKLTIRGVTKDLRIPLTIRATATGLELSGEATIKRLEFGIGQGEWKSTEWVGDAVKVSYKVQLKKAG